MSQRRGRIPPHIVSKQFHHPREDLLLITILKNVDDPRKPSCNFRHSLVTIVFISLIGIICGASDWEQIEQCAEGMVDWLSNYVDMSEGVPSAHTLKRVMSLIPTETLSQLLQNLSRSIAGSAGKTVAIDGKTLRGSRKSNGQVLHLLHAWSVEQGVCLGQVAVHEKSNEITALPALIESLELRDAVVTVDALHTHKNAAALIRGKKADYVFPVKDNQRDLAEDVRLVFHEADTVGFRGVDSAQSETMEKSAGRVETRLYALVDVEDAPFAKDWPGCKTVGRAILERTKDGKTSVETRYYISSLGLEISRFSSAVRGHWGVENGLHWALDVIFDEDKHRFQDRLGAANLSLLRKVALAILSEDKTLKCGRASKQMRAATSASYREHVLKNCF